MDLQRLDASPFVLEPDYFVTAKGRVVKAYCDLSIHILAPAAKASTAKAPPPEILAAKSAAGVKMKALAPPAGTAVPMKEISENISENVIHILAFKVPGLVTALAVSAVISAGSRRIRPRPVKGGMAELVIQLTFLRIA